MNKSLIKNIGIGCIAVGTAAVWYGGGTEGLAVEVVGGVVVIIGIIAAIFKK